MDVTANSPKIVRSFNEAIIPPSSGALFSIQLYTIPTSWHIPLLSLDRRSAIRPAHRRSRLQRTIAQELVAPSIPEFRRPSP